MSRFYFGLGAVVALGCAAPQPAKPPSQESSASAPTATAETPTVTPPVQESQVAPPPEDGAGATCNGSPDEDLQHQLAGRAAQVRFCYERLLRRDPHREGRLTVTVRLSGTGTIDNAAATLDELADPETTECALASFKEPLHGQITAGDCAIVNVPLRFLSKKPNPPDSTATP